MAYGRPVAIFFAMLIILSICVIYLYVRHAKFDGEDYYQRSLRAHYQNTVGDAYTPAARDAIYAGERIAKPRAIDSFRLGSVYLINASDPQNAHKHFTHALHDIIRGNANPADADYVVRRIVDYDTTFIELTANEDLPLQEAILAQAKLQKRELKQISRNKAATRKASGDAEFTQKTMLARQEWHHDAQNVHDSSIILDLVDQFAYVVKCNRQLCNFDQYNFDELKNEMYQRFRGDTKMMAAINRTLERISGDSVVGLIPNVKERDVVCAVYRRAYCTENKDSRESILSAIGQSLADCIEQDRIVCMAGRVTRVWASLARLDAVPAIGILKTKEALRNEVYTRAASVVDSFIGKNGTASTDLCNAYNMSEPGADVQELEHSMREQIELLRADFIDRMPSDELDKALEMCKSNV